MAKDSKESASTVQSIEGLLESHSDQLEGYDVSFDRYDQDMDMTPLFKGYTRQLYAGSEVLEFSPNDELKKTLDVMNRNMEAQKAA